MNHNRRPYRHVPCSMFSPLDQGHEHWVEPVSELPGPLMGTYSVPIESSASVAFKECT